MNGEKLSLLDEISRLVGSCYLSDLASEDKREDIIEAAKGLDSADYPLWQWQEAISYILHEDTSFTDCSKAKAYLTGQ